LDAPSVARLLHAELPVEPASFDELDRGYACALGFSELTDEQAVTHGHGFKWIQDPFTKQWWLVSGALERKHRNLL
jgi:hypothetical protein